MNRRTKVLLLLAIVALLLAAAGCVGRRIRVGKLRTESESVALGGAEAVRVEINMGAGELHVAAVRMGCWRPTLPTTSPSSSQR